MVALLAIKQVAATVETSGPAFEAASQAQTTQTFVVFTLPLMIVSAFAGVFSDRFSKRTVIVGMKALEVLLMGAGTAALFFNPEGGTLPLWVLAAMGAQSAIFSPSKYGILPELLPHQRLSWGNGQLEMWTFMAIIAGTALAGPPLGSLRFHTMAGRMHINLLFRSGTLGFVFDSACATSSPGWRHP